MSGTAERRDECQRQRDVVHATHDGRQLCAECYSGIADLLPDADWTPSTNGSSPNGKVTGRVEAIRHALLEDAIDTRDARGPARAPVFGTGDLLHRGIATLLFGARGEGKSIAALMLAMGAAATGERVLLLDRENGPMLTRSIIASVLAAHPEWT